MRNFDLYVSGILYGRLRLGDGTPQIQKLDVHTGALLDWQDLTDQDRDFYRSFVKMDFTALGQNLSRYEAGLQGTGEVSLCGERYTSEDGCSYLQRDVKFPNNKQMKEGRLIAVTESASPVALDLAGGTAVPGRACGDIPGAHAGRGTSFHRRIPAQRLRRPGARSAGTHSLRQGGRL